MKYVPSARPPPWKLVIKGDARALRSSLKIILGWLNEKKISWSITEGELVVDSRFKDPIIISAILNELHNQTKNGRHVKITIRSEVQEEN